MNDNLDDLTIDELQDYLYKINKDINVETKKLSNLKLRRTEIELRIRIKKLRADIRTE